MRAIFIRVTSFVLLYLFAELLAWVAIEVTTRAGLISYRPNVSELNEEQLDALGKLVDGTRRGQFEVAPDPVLGWRPILEANSAGMRDDLEYDVEPASGELRVSAFGDSFTYSSDVPMQHSWTKQLAAMSPSLTVFNFGSGAYGLDQAYLRYRLEKQPYRGDIVLIGYMSENIARHVNVFRPFYSPAYRQVIFTKPRFRIRDGELELLPNPVATKEDHAEFLRNHREIVPGLGENDYHYQIGYTRSWLDISPLFRLTREFHRLVKARITHPIFDIDGMYSTRSEAFELTKRIFDEFYREVLEDGSLPIIVVFPDMNDHGRSRAGKVRRYQPLLDYFDEAGYRYIDILSAIEPVESRLSVDDLTVAWGHFSPRGNQIIAFHIYHHLKRFYALSPVRVEKAMLEEQRARGIV
ncbi:MAG: hypothetical protein R3228_12190, partial [Halioglobus sp.]|nr:hypothetical protein [Halioglobus sp.]